MNISEENEKIIAACDQFLATAKKCIDSGIDLSDVEFPLAVQSADSADIDQMFIQLENAAVPVQDVPTPSESSRPDSQNADNAVYRHQLNIRFVFKIPYSSDAEFKTLCQDCLRVVCHPTKQAMDMAHDVFFFCDCGGQLCAWSDCFDLAAFVARNGSAAIVELARLGAIKPITGPFIYSPATGIVREQSK